MATGSVQTVFVCQNSYFSQAPCPSGQGVTTMQVYLLDPSFAATAELLNAPFDYTKAGQFFLFGFSTVLTFWLLGIAVGAIVNRVKRA